MDWQHTHISWMSPSLPISVLIIILLLFLTVLMNAVLGIGPGMLLPFVYCPVWWDGSIIAAALKVDLGNSFVFAPLSADPIAAADCRTCLDAHALSWTLLVCTQVCRVQCAQKGSLVKTTWRHTTLTIMMMKEGDNWVETLPFCCTVCCSFCRWAKIIWAISLRRVLCPLNAGLFLMFPLTVTLTPSTLGSFKQV